MENSIVSLYPFDKQVDFGTEQTDAASGMIKQLLEKVERR